VVAVPYFFAALATVAQSELIATVPRRIALRHAADFKLRTAPLPLSIRHFPVNMVWNRRLGDDPAIAWLRNEILRAASQVAG
jgi:DNA-binding transcriptional LysR family regulator